MAPPSIFACYAFNNGGCHLSKEACVFTHVFSDPGSQYLQIRHPDLSLGDVPIAEAAAKAGFDCSNWPKLKSLIDAVRAVNATVSYPDRWNGRALSLKSMMVLDAVVGWIHISAACHSFEILFVLQPKADAAIRAGPAAFQNSFYPDHWTAAHQARQKRTGLQAYLDAERVPSVPAFVVSAAQILRNINNLPRVRGSKGAPAMRGPDSSRIALGPVSGNKRSGDETIDLLSSSPKRTKTEQLVQSSSIIDLTKDDEPMEYVPTRRLHPRQASTRMTKTAGSGPWQSQRKARQRAAKDRMSRESVGILAQIASKLRASAHALDVDRDTLRQRWEIDENLQLQTVTDILAALNECFGRAEDGIRDALDVIEKRLI